MKKQLILVCVIVFNLYPLYSQLPVKLYPFDSLKVYGGGNMSIWGDFHNTANVSSGGSLVVNLNGKITIFGDTFNNSNASIIGGNGNIEMKRPRPAPYSSNTSQFLISGGQSVSFPTFTVNTSSSIYIYSDDLRIRDTLKFISGHILLNQHDLIIGNNSTGTITGYNENNFIVTEGNATDTQKGFLIREQISSINTVFPVGHSVGEYSPVSISNNGTTDNFKVRVFDTVYENGYDPTTYYYPPGPLTANERSVQRTWDIREANTGGSDVTLILQYDTVNESNAFRENRNKSFISHFTGIYPNNYGDTVSNWKWDMFKLSSTSAPSSPGLLTTGSSIGSAAMKTRNNVNSFSPFSITTWTSDAVPLPLHILSFEAEWFNTTDAKIKWQLADMENVASIHLERSLDGPDFHLVQKFNPVNPSGHFYATDPGVYNKTYLKVYYRLKIIDMNGAVSYSDLIRLNKLNVVNSGLVQVFPNPANEILHVQSDNFDHSEPFTIELLNLSGEIIYTHKFESTTATSLDAIIPIDQFPAGIYEILINSVNGRRTQKVIICH